MLLNCLSPTLLAILRITPNLFLHENLTERPDPRVKVFKTKLPQLLGRALYRASQKWPLLYSSNHTLSYSKVIIYLIGLGLLCPHVVH